MDDVMPTREQLDAWPNCATPDCDAKACTWSYLDLCFPCGERRLGKAAMIAAYDETHDLTWEEVARIEAAAEGEGEWTN
jgi:hypothetical protein